MRGWKRRSRGIRKKQKRLWFYLYLHPGVDLHTLYQMYGRNERRKQHRFKSIMDGVQQRAEGKTHYEDCAYHPCLITLLDLENDDIEGISLIDGTSPRSCSLLNCGVVFFTEEEAIRRADYINQHGWDKYHANYESFK
jgi:hypothetical protein